ncbi:autotransporter outer membrane beta-barrel domain-containing protein [Taklimakanibacter lacteus]|uniref:autotransporter outer membrane beta-barrel domain-containing protein n=1 Tax=Taklimakanibacter lacteus TaxID=2268456 RepID=UPI000E6712D6
MGASALAALAVSCYQFIDLSQVRADDACVGGGGIITCSGDQSEGVNGSGNTSVTVNNLNQPIAPPDNVPGIIVTNTGTGGSDGGGIGEDGGNGGTGPSVLINFDGSQPISTDGTPAAGIFGRSTGGSGGNGGNAAIVNAGDAGNGGAGGSVTINSSGTIQSTGTDSPGLMAISRGGNGGIGGDSSVTGDAGTGGGGGAAGAVTVNNQSNITTGESGSAGIIARSLGGNGGNGGDGFLVIIGSGGGGGATGIGGPVNVTSTGVITTTGPSNAAGIFAQSVGGFAGSGGDAIGLITFGGDGNSGGHGGNVEVHVNGGSITTSGSSSSAVFAQSVGGGGGAGGVGGGLVGFGGAGTVGGNGGTVLVTNSVALTTNGVQSAGIFAQSVGGSGGSGAPAGGAFAIGGSGGPGGNGSGVTVNSSGPITTQLEQSDGIFAQSVGGGGGSGGVAGGLVGIGGTGGEGGIGGAVSVTASTSITTSGTNSAGIYAQSIGGGGGRGGATGGVVAVGGKGSSGGGAGTVTVNNSAAITTNGIGSEAIFAQSIGGGGGDGGFAGGWFNFGGSGAKGGNGGLVTVTNSGNLTTHKEQSSALFAQSVGGGGGSGGGAVGGGLFISLSIGGSGGPGGTGGEVKINEFNNAGTPGYTIITEGERSAGVFAQSIGGGGGNGGYAVSAAVGLYGGAAASFGGTAAGGGDAAQVIVGNNGSITTKGNFSAGISAQSTGGGGGDGGFSIAAAASTGAAASLSFGGKGGAAGAGKKVTVNSFTTIDTTGTQSHGIFAHSAGGGGGTGGFAISVAGAPYGALGLSFGGDGAGGGAGGEVLVNSTGNITTKGTLAHGILAESIGGGGGSGGFSIAAGLTISSGGVSADLSFGGKGDGGGEGQRVDVNSTGKIDVAGQGAIGIFAQSVGGGGGNGGFAGALSVAAGTTFGLSMGGAGGTASKGGIVNVTNNGTIVTGGENGIGILAQSIGGGGGYGGFGLVGTFSLDGDAEGHSIGGTGGKGGAGDNVTVNHTGDITTNGNNAAGILAQSVSGGGGTGGFSAGVSASYKANAKLGGVGGTGGDAANTTDDNLTVVTVNAGGGKILTKGAMSHGIHAQSIGGGGGSGGFAVGAGLSIKGESEAEVGGGSAGAGGNAGQVKVTNSGAIETQGHLAIGIFAQSVGGGGGTGGFAIGGSFTSGDDAGAATNSVGGSGGVASRGGNVEVTNQASGTILTLGNRSHGIQAQSIGGGGGSGGFAIGAAVSLDGDAESDIGGGAGGAGGNAGTVTVVNHGSIETRGKDAIGVFAQSVGGGGGDGGFSITGSYGSKAANNSVGGNGGGSSMGGTVSVTNTGSITTGEVNSIGILAQSIGGGGGSGGFSISAALSSDEGGENSSVGGEGTGGGNGGDVTVINSGTILTKKSESTGIKAQSIGGGGGNGAFTIAGSLSSGGDTTSSVGGNAGGGGNGGVVKVTNTGTITVAGANSFGVFAQSVGGGGGSGGISGGLSTGGQIDNVVGGSGGKGGNGGEVTVESSGDIFVTGANSSAVFAQSVAGGGGWGGLYLGLGGGGSDGLKVGLGATGNPLDGLPVTGETGKVTVTINGQTTITEGKLSYGLLAQAIGGGGGAAGTVMDGLLNLTGSNVVMDVGSNGAMNGHGKLLTGSYSNDATMGGVGSIGLIAQSIGGGGGVNGMALDQVSLNPAGNDEFLIRVGGFSAGAQHTGGGTGGGFDFTATGTVTTKEKNAIGVLAQTIGGGGGVGNLTVESVTNTANALRITVGGSQLTEGDGGDASKVTAQDTIVTGGALSHGMVAQSIGGGGGVSNLLFQNGVSTSGVTITLGSGGTGAGGDGGDLTATAADVSTTGSGAMGIVAQSIGGGGGLTGIFSNGLIFGQDGFSAGPLTIVGGAAADGDGGVVAVFANGAVHTTGYGAHGVVAQSIGGGGGIAGGGLFATTLGGTSAFAGSVGGDGSGKDVDVTTLRNVVVAGQNSVGIFGQSAGPDGQGAVDIRVDKSGNGVGLIWALAGMGSAVQFADGATNTLQTDGTLYAQGSIVGTGLPNLGGIAIRGGSGDENLTNLAYLFPAAPPPGTFGFGADYGVLFDMTTGALDPVTNLPLFDAGTRTNNIIGNVDVAGGNNNLTNQAGALFITEKSVTLDDDGNPNPLGSGQELTNHGLLSPGDRGRIQVTDVGGNFVETLTGKYFIDIDLNQQNTGNQLTDRLNVTGGSGVGGEGGLLLLSINKAFTEYVIVSSAEGTADNGFTPKLTPPAIGFNFKVKLANADQDLVLYADKPPLEDLLKDPASGTRDPNVWRMGEGLDNIENAITVDDPFNYLINILRLQPDAKALGDAVVTLTPSQAPHIFEATFRRNMAFLDQMIDCPQDFGQGWFADRRSCVWGKFSYSVYDRDSVEDSPTNADVYSGFSFGAHAAVDENWQLGFGFEKGEINSDQERDGSPLSTLESDIYQFGASATYRNSGFGMALAAAGSYGDWDARRFVNVNGFVQNYTSFEGIMMNEAGVEQPAFVNNEIVFDGVSGTARSKPEVFTFNPRLRLSYIDTFGGVDVMPYLDVDAYILHSERREEEGVGLTNLEYPAKTETAFTFTPGLELGGTTQLDEGSAIRAFLRGSVMLATDDSWTALTQFAAAPEGLPDIEIIDDYDDVLGKVDAGLMAFGAWGHQLRLNYSGIFGETTEQHAVSGDFTYRF